MPRKVDDSLQYLTTKSDGSMHFLAQKTQSLDTLALKLTVHQDKIVEIFESFTEDPFQDL